MKALVLLSSGLDSSFNLYAAKKKYQKLFALTFNYGQVSFQKEIYYSRKICKKLKIQHEVLKLDFFSYFKTNLFLKGKIPLSKKKNLKLQEMKQMDEKVWLSNRNGIFLNIAAGICEERKIKDLLVGFNKEEARNFPDNSEIFLKKINESLKHSLKYKVQVKSLSLHLNKKQLIQKALKLKINLNDLWPCYLAEKRICRKCPSCLRFLKALSEVQK